MRDYLLVTKALANESRIRILKLLETGRLCVSHICDVIGLRQSTVSKHLFTLRTAGLVDDQKDGIWVYYRLCDERINDYNLVFLELIRCWLNGDKKILADKEKLKIILNR